MTAYFPCGQYAAQKMVRYSRDSARGLLFFFFSPGWDLMTGGRPKAPDSFFVAENYRGVNAKFRLHVHLLG